MPAIADEPAKNLLTALKSTSNTDAQCSAGLFRSTTSIPSAKMRPRNSTRSASVLAEGFLTLAGSIVCRFLACFHRDLANKLEEKRIEDGAWRVVEWTQSPLRK